MWTGKIRTSLQPGNWRNQSQDETIKSVQKEKKRVFIFLVVAGIIPVLCLCGCMLSQVILAAQKRTDALAARDDAYSFLAVVKLVESLTMERGLSSAFTRSKGQQLEGRFVQAMADVDEKIQNVPFSKLKSDREEISSRDVLTKFLQRHRKKLWKFEVRVQDNQLFYLDLMEDLIKANMKIITLSRTQGELWRKVAAAGFLLKASLNIDVVMSLSRTFFFDCDYSTADFYWYLKSLGAEDQNLHMTFLKYPPLEADFNAEMEALPNNKELPGVKSLLIRKDEFMARCVNFTKNERSSLQFPWWEPFLERRYMLAEFRTEFMDRVIEDLEVIVHDIENNMMRYIVICLLVMLISIFLIALQTKNISEVVNDAIITATRYMIATYNVDSEQKRSTGLLYKMVPPAVAEQLKSGHQVEPQYFSSATICYIDVVDFMTVAARIQAQHAAYLIRELLRIIEFLAMKHNVHFIDNIANDIFTLVSGIPIMNDTHVANIANFTIQLVESVKRIQVAEFPDVKIGLRVGIHTGACAAGIVGHKIPHYSVFGENVKMADRLCHSSPAGKIQISCQTKEALDQHGDHFRTTKRGIIDFYGIGKFETYFLDGCKTNVDPPFFPPSFSYA